MNSSKALKSLRGKKLKTQDDVAESIGVSRQTYNYIENNVLDTDISILFNILFKLDANEAEVNDFLFAVQQDFKSYEKTKEEEVV